MDRLLPLPITLEDPPRMEMVMDSFRSGGYVYQLSQPMSIGLQLSAENRVDVRLFVQSSPSERTDASAKRLFDNGRAILQELFASWPPLQKFIQGKMLAFRLFEDYGTGSILLCTEANGSYAWN